MISVILANYNGEVFLHEALISVINQNFNDFELIVIDDGSTDNSKNIINEFVQRYPKRIQAKFLTENQGQGASFNIGFAESRGDQICFMDSDDIWFPNKLNSVSIFFSLGHKNIAFLQHNLFFMRNDTITDKKLRNTLVSGNLYKTTQITKKLPVGFIPTSGLTFPRKILEKILPIPKEFKLCADGFLTRTAFCYGEIASISESWGGYRVHSCNNIFENPHHDNLGYANNILIPALNNFYKVNNLNLNIVKQHKLFSIKSMVEYMMPPIIPKAFNYLCRRYKYTINKSLLQKQKNF